jgi:hypothetical protein
MQLAGILGEHNVKLVPDIAVAGDGSRRPGGGDDRQAARRQPANLKNGRLSELRS